MSGLHEAVARAIRDASHGALGAALPVHNDKRWDDTTRPDCQTCNKAAAAAVRVVLAEAQRSIEALGTEWTHARAGVTSYEPARAADFKREALAALAALGEGADARIDA